MSEVDFHIAPIIFFIFIGGLVVPANYYLWFAGAMVAIPQGRIYVRAFWDYPKFKKPKAKYLLMNEGAVMMSTLVFVGISLLRL